ncbi:MAG: hypothetical protein Q9193_000118 [Seirophora villosa]
MLQDSLEFVVEGNVYVATQGFPVITGDWIRQLVYDWLAHDDVFVRPFLSTIIFFGVNMSEVAVQDDACDLLRDWAGTRIVVKDMFNIKGLRTSVGNRDFFNLYPPCTDTASAIQRLIDAGAEILGKSKLSSFAAREEPTESVDFQAPFNPRGDGYQSPAGSSSGSAAAVSSYDWLDFAIGSDNVSKFKDFACAWYGADLGPDRVTQSASSSFGNPSLRVYGKPPKIFYPLEFMQKVGGEQKRQIDEFVRDLESTLGVKKTMLSLAREWETSAPESLAKQGLQVYMQNAPTHAFFYDLYHNFDKFREDFDAKYTKTPYVSPMLRWRWQIAQDLTQDQREDAIERLETFKGWFLDKVMRVDDHTSFMVFPIEEMTPNYRDEPPASPTMPKSISMLDIAPTLAAPELAIPIGELAYESRVSNRTEFLPVAVSLMGPPGKPTEPPVYLRPVN